MSTLSTSTTATKIGVDIPGREADLLAHIQTHAQKGDLKSVMTTIDKYCWDHHWMMNLGDVKGQILDKELQKKAPKRVLELGTYCGYSGLRILSNLESVHLITIEMNAQSASIAGQIFEFAGVADRVTQINLATDVVIPTLFQKYGSFELIFIDHWKDVYLRDLKLLETYGLIGKGSVIVADNVIYPGAPDYLKYVRNNPNYETHTYESRLEYTTDVMDAVEVSIRLN